MLNSVSNKTAQVQQRYDSQVEKKEQLEDKSIKYNWGRRGFIAAGIFSVLAVPGVAGLAALLGSIVGYKITRDQRNRFAKKAGDLNDEIKSLKQQVETFRAADYDIQG